jgi:hypothetical protein
MTGLNASHRGPRRCVSPPRIDPLESTIAISPPDGKLLSPGCVKSSDLSLTAPEGLEAGSTLRAACNPTVRLNANRR